MPATIEYHIEPEELEHGERQAVNACAAQLGQGTTLIVKRDAQGELVIEVGRPQQKTAAG